MTVPNKPPEDEFATLLAYAHDNLHDMANRLDLKRKIDLGHWEELNDSLEAVRKFEGDKRGYLLRLRGNLMIISSIGDLPEEVSEVSTEETSETDCEASNEQYEFFKDDDDDEHEEEIETQEEACDRIKQDAFQDVIDLCDEMVANDVVQWRHAFLTCSALLDVIENASEDDNLKVVLCGSPVEEEIENRYVELLLRANLDEIDVDVLDTIDRFKKISKSSVARLKMLDTVAKIASRFYLRDEEKSLCMLHDAAKGLVQETVIYQDDVAAEVIIKMTVFQNLHHILRDGKIPTETQLSEYASDDPLFAKQNAEMVDIYKRKLKASFLEHDFQATAQDLDPASDRLQKMVEPPPSLYAMTHDEIISVFDRGMTSSQPGVPGCRLN